MSFFANPQDAGLKPAEGTESTEYFHNRVNGAHRAKTFSGSVNSASSVVDNLRRAVAAAELKAGSGN
jgi:hypothetical protein